MAVAVAVAFGDVQVDGGREGDGGNRDQPDCAAVAEPERYERADERRGREQRPGASSAEPALSLEVQPQAQPKPSRTARQQRERRRGARPGIANRERDQSGERRAEQRFPEHDRARIEVGKRSGQRIVQRPTERCARNCHQPQRARRANSFAAQRQDHAAQHHQRRRRQHAAPDRFRVECARQHHGEHGLEIQQQRRRQRAGVLQPPSQTCRRQRGAEQRHQREPTDLRASQGWLIGAPPRQTRAQSCTAVQ